MTETKKDEYAKEQKERQGHIEYIVGGKELIDEVGPLWMELNAHHARRSHNFEQKFQAHNYECRKTRFLQDDKELMVVLVKDRSKASYVGYSVSSIEVEAPLDDTDAGLAIGEIESIYLDPAYRGFQIGEELMRKPLSWFDQHKVTKVVLGVAAGNEEVFPFYKKFGFYPRTTIMERIK